MRKLILQLLFIIPIIGLTQTNPVYPYMGVATGTNSYSVTIGGQNNPSSPKTGQTIYVKVTNPNSGASTLKVTTPTSSYSAKEITQNGSALTGGEIVQNVWNILTYDTLSGGQWQFLGRTIGTYTGSVTTVSVVTANGVSGTVANPTTTPAITLSVTPNLNNPTGITPVVNGGTSSSLAATNGTVLRGNGTSWLPSTFTIDDTFGAYQIPYPSSANTLTSSNLFTYDGTSLVLGNQSSVATIPFWIFKNYAGEQQMRITNTNTSASSLSSIIVDNGQYRTYLKQLSTGFSSDGVLGAQVGVLEALSGLAIKSGSHIYWATGGTTTQKMILNSSGYLGIGNTITPTEMLDVENNFRLRGAFMPGNTAGSSGQVLTSAGAGTAPTWTTPTTGTITSVSATSPLSSSGGSTPTISITNPIPMANGGTNASITADDGAIFYSTATKGALTATNKAYWDYTNGRLGLGKNSGLDATLTTVSTGTTYASSPLVLLNSNNDTILKVRSDGKIKACDPLSNLFIGSNNGQYNTTGSKNTSLGYGSLITNIIGIDNTTVGYSAGIQIAGSFNTAIGSSSQVLSTSSNANTSVGYVSLFSNVSGGNNSALGVGAGYNSLGSYNSFWGYHAGYNWTGSNRTFIQAGQRDSAITIDGNNGQFNITNGHIKIVDGSQGSGKVLTSDGNGLGTWTTLSTGVSSVSAISPLSSSGGATPTISITSPIPLANGGTNTSIAASNGSVIYSDASKYAMTNVGTAGQLLQSNGATAPSFVSNITPTTISTTSATITTSAVTNPISLNIANHGDNSTSVNSTGALITSDQALTSTGIDVSATSIDGGVANAITASAVNTNSTGYNNGIGAFASGAKYNTAASVSASGGTNAVGLTISASGASTVNAAISVPTGSVGIGTIITPEAQLEIQNTEGLDATLALDADDGDDNGDTWFMKSEATTNDFSLTNNTTKLLAVTSDGRLYGTALHNNYGDVTGTTNQYICSGTYTATIVNVENVGAASSYPCQWIRVGNVVTVSGEFQIDPTLASTQTLFTATLPIASNFNNFYQCNGTCGNGESTGNGVIYGSSGLAQFSFNPLGAQNQPLYFTFTYLIL